MDESSYASRDGAVDLAMLWRGFRSGEWYLAGAHYLDGSCYATIEPRRRTISASILALNVLQRVLAGEAQKVLAYELGRAPATIANYCAQALRAISLEHNPARAPILVVMAAAGALGARVPEARLERKLDDGSWLVSVGVPGRTLAQRLSPSEQEVARAAIEGKSHAEIASERGTSMRTVANQLASIFSKTGAYGCSALRAKVAIESAL